MPDAAELFRDDWTLEQISEIKCHMRDTLTEYDYWSTRCAARCPNCNILIYHFIKKAIGYRLTDILWNLKIERRFFQGSQNNICFRNSFPKMEFEIESLDKETLTRLDNYVNKECISNFKTRELSIKYR